MFISKVNPMSLSDMHDVIFPLVGLLIIVATFFIGKTVGARPVELKLEKLGGFYLKADFLSLFFLAGLALIGIGIYIVMHNRDANIDALRRDLVKKEESINQVRQDLEMFKRYNMLVTLVMDQSENPKKLHYLLIRRKRDGDPREEPCTPQFADNKIWVRLTDVQHGEVVKIVAIKDSSNTWATEEIEIPHARAFMKKQ